MSPQHDLPSATSQDLEVRGRAAMRVGDVLLGKYRIDRVLGVGGMAAVYAATHRNGKRFAIKLLHSDLSHQSRVRARFLREGYVANAVGHPGVVVVLDDDVAEDGAAFLVMELLEGHPIDALGARPGSRIPLRESLGIAYQVLDVLHVAHSKSIVHRDIKPANLYLLRDGQVKVLDFGLAQVRDAAAAICTTMTGERMGTPAFMPPEQALGDVNAVDARSDIWALGATIFTAISGCLVHDGDNVQQLLLRAATVPARSLAKAAPEVPTAVVELLDKALEFDKAKRWNSAIAMRDAVARTYTELFGELRREYLASFLESSHRILLKASTNTLAGVRLLNEEHTLETLSVTKCPAPKDQSFANTLTSPDVRQRRVHGKRLRLKATSMVTLTVAVAATALVVRLGTRQRDRQMPPSVSSRVLPVLPAVSPVIRGRNPFTDIRLYVNAYSDAANQVNQWRLSRPTDALSLQKIASQPVGWWLGEWSGNIESTARELGNLTNSAGVVPVVVVYYIPKRDCGQHSKGGAPSAEAYRIWIRQLAKGAANARMIVVLEPDALAMLTGCLSSDEQNDRLSLMNDAVDTLVSRPNISVYIDAGHPKWIAADEMARRLAAAGVSRTDGFALNVSNFVTTAINIEYGHTISAALGGKHFIIDTGRNGNGSTIEAAWCNPQGRALGQPPTTNTGDPLIDAFFWVKPPGHSDGECNGGPKGGDFWVEQALELARGAHWQVADTIATGSVETP